MTENIYKSYRIIDGKPRWVIADENGKIINNNEIIDNPKKENLKIDNGKIEKYEKSWTESEIYNVMRQFYQKHGRIPIRNDFAVNSKKYPRPSIIYKICGNWTNAIYNAGLGNIPKRFLYTKEQLINILNNFYQKTGEVPVCNNFDYGPNLPCSNTIKNYFGSWNNAIKEAGLWNKRYNETNTCYKCIEEGKTIEDSKLTGIVRREKDNNGKHTGRWICTKHWNRDNYNNVLKNDPNSQNNIIKSLRNIRTGNIDPESNQGKGYKGERLLCIWKGFINLNEKYDNYEYPIDCFDEKTGLYYQVKVSYFNPIDRYWYQGFDSEFNSINKGYRFKSLFLICVSSNGNTIERIYEIPEEEIKENNKKSIGIAKNPVRKVWHSRYRINDIEKANVIWQDL